MKYNYFYLFAFALTACGNNNQQKRKDADSSVHETLTSKQGVIVKTKTHASMPDDIKSKIQGAWTDGSDVNANFLIEQDSIIYIEQPAYKYELKDDSIKIFSDGKVYNGKISFKGDTLIMKDAQSDILKYWKFKE